MPRSVWMLIGAALTLATTSTITLAISAAHEGVPTQVYSLSLGVTIIAWVGVIVITAVQSIKAFIAHAINNLETNTKTMVFHILATSMSESNGYIRREITRNHLRSVDK